VATSAALNATLQLKVDYTDISGANFQDSGTPSSFGVVGAKLPFTFVLQAIPGTPINLSLSTTNTPVYTLNVDLEAL
jgi:hypothetical protein